MLLELMGMAIGASVVEGSRLVKSAKMDDRALKKYAQAFEKNEEARQLVKTKTEFTDKRLMNVARKKRAVMEDAIPKFVEVYSQIQKIDLRGAEDSVNLPLSISEERQAGLQALTLSAKKAFTDKELVCGLMMKGLGGMAIKDSERNLSAARNQLSQAEVIYSQAESVCAACDAVIARADRIARLLTASSTSSTLRPIWIKPVAASSPVRPPPMITICFASFAASMIASVSSISRKPYTPLASRSPFTGGRKVWEPVAISSLS